MYINGKKVMQFIKTDAVNVDESLSETSENAVQNKVVTKELNDRVKKSDIDSAVSSTSENPVQNKAITNSVNLNMLGAPSERYLDISPYVGSYNVLANGYICVRGQVKSSVNYGSIDIFNNTTGMCTRSLSYDDKTGSEPGVRLFLPVKKGDNITITFNAGRTELGAGYARFYYAEEV